MKSVELETQPDSGDVRVSEAEDKAKPSGQMSCRRNDPFSRGLLNPAVQPIRPPRLSANGGPDGTTRDRTAGLLLLLPPLHGPLDPVLFAPSIAGAVAERRRSTGRDRRTPVSATCLRGVRRRSIVPAAAAAVGWISTRTYWRSGAAGWPLPRRHCPLPAHDDGKMGIF